MRTGSQNHRMFGVGRDLCGSPSPTPLPKQGHPEQAAQHRVQAGFEYLQRRKLHSLPGQPGPGLRHPQREEVLPRVQTELPLLQSSATSKIPELQMMFCHLPPAQAGKWISETPGRQGNPRAVTSLTWMVDTPGKIRVRKRDPPTQGGAVPSERDKLHHKGQSPLTYLV